MWDQSGFEMCGILVANATMFSHLLRDSHVVANICYCHKFMVPTGIVNLNNFCAMFVMRSSTQPKTTAA